MSMRGMRQEQEAALRTPLEAVWWSIESEKEDTDLRQVGMQQNSVLGNY